MRLTSPATSGACCVSSCGCAPSLMLDQLSAVVDRGCRRALVELDRDRWSSWRGGVGRRHWGWRPGGCGEATYQRAVLPVAWYAGRAEPDQRAPRRGSMRRAIAYAARIHHADGSFDQAFPHEHSWGATAF